MVSALSFAALKKKKGSEKKQKLCKNKKRKKTRETNNFSSSFLLLFFPKSPPRRRGEVSLSLSSYLQKKYHQGPFPLLHRGEVERKSSKALTPLKTKTKTQEE